MSTAVPFGLSLPEQIQSMAGWSSPIVLSTVAMVLTRPRTEILTDFSMMDLEVLITERRKGAKPGCRQFYLGGYTDANDCNLVAAAFREAEEELGVELKGQRKVELVGLFGPPVYTSTLSRSATGLTLDVSSVPAEPRVRFQLTMFRYEFDHPLPQDLGETDEVRVVGWMKLGEIIDYYGKRPSQFLYPHLLFDFVRFVGSGQPILYPSSEPGSYTYRR